MILSMWCNVGFIIILNNVDIQSVKIDQKRSGDVTLEV